MTIVEFGLAFAAIIGVWRLGTIAEDLADAVRSPKDHRVHLPTLPKLVVEHRQGPTTQGEGE